MYLSAISRNL